MVVRTPGRFTVKDFDALPETGPQYQLVDGELLEMTPPNAWHQAFLAELFRLVANHVRDHGLGKALFSPIGVYLSPHDAFQPDILFLSNERRDRFERKGIMGAPDLVVEALSPSTERLDLGKKRLKYAEHGVIEYWIADIDAETIAVYRLQEDPERPVRTLGRGDVLSTPLLPGFTAEVGALFAR